MQQIKALRNQGADQGVSKYTNKDNLLREVCNAHSKDIITGDFAMNLDLIATGGRDNVVRIWDYEKIVPLEEIKGDQSPEGANEITMVKFIQPFPLLLTSDNTGQIYVWLTKPHPQAGLCVLNWRNNYTLKANSPITAIDTYYNPQTEEFVMCIGDDMGTVRLQDISAIRKQKQVKIEP